MNFVATSNVEVPYYLGPGQFAIKAPTMASEVKNAVSPTGAITFCVPLHLASVC